ncbi:MAG: HlyD family efflux transporter periplasmic adaptor subunit [Anaerolineae bacterium]|nr:HlyD family efflux transporter periplasmic adaptor subunit [Anaerolineae bacterium]
MKTKLLLSLLLILGLSACSGVGSTPAPIATVVLDSGADSPAPASPSLGGVVASGFVTPSEEAALAFGMAGRISQIHIAVGKTVKAGDLLVELENTALQIELAQAERNLKEMTSPTALAAAQLAQANANKALEDAQEKVTGLGYARASETRIDNLQAEIDLAEQALARAQDAYKPVSRLPDGDNRKATALYAMTNAQLHLNNLLAEYNWLTGKPTEIDAAITQANFETAQAAAREAQWYLLALQGQELPPEASGAQLAALEAAQNALALAQERLTASRLLAPIDGEIVSIELNTGEYAQPGLPVVFISNVSELQVETSDLSEKDVVKVAAGQPVSVRVDALGQTISGEVINISPVASTLGGDVVYKTTLRLEKPYPEGLRAGMSVDVQFGE